MDGSSLKSVQLLEQMRLHLATDAGKEIVKKVGLVYQFNISPKKIGVDEEIFTVDLKKGEVTKGPYDGKPDATFSFTDSDFLALATGKMNPQIAFISFSRCLMNCECYVLQRRDKDQGEHKRGTEVHPRYLPQACQTVEG
uniref:SCP2 domain-containing protein n=1 Tax=Oryza brachyantha TaxID=4533 RepID=J3MCA8_ORYBR